MIETDVANGQMIYILEEDVTGGRKERFVVCKVVTLDGKMGWSEYVIPRGKLWSEYIIPRGNSDRSI